MFHFNVAYFQVLEFKLIMLLLYTTTCTNFIPMIRQDTGVQGCCEIMVVYSISTLILQWLESGVQLNEQGCLFADQFECDQRIFVSSC